jgi:glycosyltransferase involved in cell wall biosynthesis
MGFRIPGNRWAMTRFKIGILASHPIQYHAPLYRELATRCDLTVYFAHRQTAAGQAEAGFNVAFEWDVDLLAGYDHRFLKNTASRPDVNRFWGCDTPEIRHEIRVNRFDAFLVNGWYLKAFWQAIRACKATNTPMMVRGDSQLGTPRSSVKQMAKAWLYPLLLRQFDACLYVGQRNRDYLRYYGVTEERLFFSPHCIDNEFFRSHTGNPMANRLQLGISTGQIALLFAGKLTDKKRPMDMLQAVKALRSQGLDICGVFAGSGPLEAELKQYACDHHLPVTFLGFVNQTRLPEIYAMADLLVLPSDGGETWGLVVNESLACGTPVVVSDAVGCAPDLVSEGETGALFRMGDIDAFTQAVVRALRLERNSDMLAKKSAAYSVSAAADGVISAVANVRRCSNSTEDGKIL